MNSDQKKRIVITGVGVVAPNGLGKDEFWRHCASGVSGIKPITLFDVSKYRCRWAGEISNFKPEECLGPKGLRNLDRTTLLSLVAAKLAIDDAKLEITDENRNNIGVVLGSTMGSVHSISEFDKEGLREGPRYVNPAHFPNTVINSPASQVAIRFCLRGLNATISTGFTASLDAIGYALDMLQLERADALLVGGVEELCIQTFLGFYKLGFLATSQNGVAPFYGPFDARHCGALLGEGAAFFVLEPLERARARQAAIYAELLGYSSQFHPACLYRYDPEAIGPVAVVQQVLKEAGLSSTDIDSISASANSTKAGDAMEQTVLNRVFHGRTARAPTTAAAAPPVAVVKSLLGESFSASGALQLAAVLGTLAGTSQQTALVNSFGPTGIASALVVSHRGEG